MIRKPHILAVTGLLILALITSLGIFHSSSPFSLASVALLQNGVPLPDDPSNNTSESEGKEEPIKVKQPPPPPPPSNDQELPLRTVQDFSDRKIIKHYYTEASLQDVPPVSKKHSILFNVIIGGNDAYGSDRKFSDLMATLRSLWQSHPDYFVTLGFMIHPELEFNAVDEYFKANPVGGVDRVTLVFAPFLEGPRGINGADRHKDSIQRVRRRTIARIRNYLVHTTLEELDYTFFMDADIGSFDRPETILPLLIYSDKPIVVPRVTLGGNKDYDMNSWRGERTKPSKEQLDKMNEDKWDDVDYVPKDVGDKMKHIKNFIDDNDNPDPMKTERLDSVGGAVLFIKSTVLRQGVVFPTSYIVGSAWERKEGYDGIETEGVCYLAKPLGYECWAMPNLVAHHLERPGS